MARQVPEWYTEIADDESAIDARIRAQGGHSCQALGITSPVPQSRCTWCVPAALIVPTPEPVDYTLPACER